MNLTKLFEAQKKLRERIDYNGEDRFEKLILALLVEIGECANEWRGFKFWSKNQIPRTYGIKGVGLGIATYNPLLEEYVDGLHFVLELGIELNINTDDFFGQYTSSNVTEQFVFVFRDVSELHKSIHEDWDEEHVYETLVEMFMGYIGLGDMLGFTQEEIEQAYFDKNQINHERQNNGY